MNQPDAARDDSLFKARDINIYECAVLQNVTYKFSPNTEQTATVSE